LCDQYFELHDRDLMFMALSNPTSRSSLALSNLRAFVILIVLAFHSMLAYVQWTPANTADFDNPAPYAWRAFAVIDDQRFSDSTCFAPGRTST
jgi:hypothetical protein